jgi:hypothetical protein
MLDQELFNEVKMMSAKISVKENKNISMAEFIRQAIRDKLHRESLKQGGC